MTEYWVSKEKHYCKSCTCWVQNNKISIRNHEQSNRHKDMLQASLERKQKQDKQAEYERYEMEKTLQQIERDAHAKYAIDIATNSFAPQVLSSHSDDYSGIGPPPPPPPPRSGISSGRVPPPPPPRPSNGMIPPPPPPRPASAHSLDLQPNSTKDIGPVVRTKFQQQPVEVAPTSRLYHPSVRLNDKDLLLNEEEEDDDPHKQKQNPSDLGIYSVRGTVYLQGKHHEDKLVSGTKCEIWVESAGKWFPATVDSTSKVSVPNTSLLLKKYKLSYSVCSNDADNELTNKVNDEDISSESDVSADRIRLKMPEGSRVEDVMKALKSNTPVFDIKPPIINENTGYGQWSTVSVKIVSDEDKLTTVKINSSRDKKAAKKEKKKKAQQVQLKIQEVFEREADDAMSAFNPWGGLYKGVEVSTEESTDKCEKEYLSKPDNDSSNGPVSFQKRKKNSNSNKKRRKLE